MTTAKGRRSGRCDWSRPGEGADGLDARLLCRHDLGQSAGDGRVRGEAGKNRNGDGSAGCKQNLRAWRDKPVERSESNRGRLGSLTTIPVPRSEPER